MATFGTVDTRCPACGRPLHIPVVAAGPISMDADTVSIRLDLDRDYLRAHALTHGPHDGEPYSTLAAVA